MISVRKLQLLVAVLPGDSRAAEDDQARCCGAITDLPRPHTMNLWRSDLPHLARIYSSQQDVGPTSAPHTHATRTQPKVTKDVGQTVQQIAFTEGVDPD